jgi:hypothetical protein
MSETTTQLDLLSTAHNTIKPTQQKERKKKTIDTTHRLPLSSQLITRATLSTRENGGEGREETKKKTKHNTTTGHKLPTPYKQMEKEKQKARFLDIKTCSFSPSIRSQREHIDIVSPCSALSTSPLRDSVDLKHPPK